MACHKIEIKKNAYFNENFIGSFIVASFVIEIFFINTKYFYKRIGI